MKVNNSRILCFLLISFSLLYNSCTLVGLGIGAMVDYPKPDSGVVKPNDYEKIKRNNEITIHLKDNSSKVGKFYGIYEGYLVLGSWPDFQRINLDEIRSVEIKAGEKHGKRYGLGIGLAIDAGIILFAIKVLAGISASD